VPPDSAVVKLLADVPGPKRHHLSQLSTRILHQTRIRPDYSPKIEDTLFIEGPQAARRLVNFFALLLWATVITIYGVLSNSSPTVIGAMIVAPLMGPLMATTATVGMGSVPRALRAFTLTVVGTGSVILLSYLLSWSCQT
jgi:hypothetical protein